MSEPQQVVDLAETLAGALKVDERNATLPPMESVYERIFHHWGGMDKFAKDFVDCCKSTQQGSQKARLMESVLDGLKVLKGFGLLGSPVDAEALDDAELEAEIKRETEKAAKVVIEGMDGRV